MLGTLSILFPVFALIAVGFIARKSEVMGENGARELSRFVVWMALPALLFLIMAKSDWSQLWQADFISVYFLGTFGVFLVVIAWRLQQGIQVADASVDGLAASYANTGYIGFPLMFLVFGSVSEIPTTLASIIVVSLLFGFTIVLLESALHVGVSWQTKVRNVGSALLKNPLVISPIAGAVFASTSWHLPAGIKTFLELLAAAASPAALVSLGLFLADAWKTQSSQSLPVGRVVTQLVAFKLIVQPVLIAWLAFYVFEMDTQWALMAILLAALPTGTGPYMLAEFYQKDAYITAQTILFSTLGSLVSLSIILYWMDIAL